jgi:hypothetical protein
LATRPFCPRRVDAQGMNRELGVGRVEFTGGALDGGEGRLDRMWWKDGVQYAQVTLPDGQQLVMELMRAHGPAEEPLPREVGS